MSDASAQVYARLGDWEAKWAAGQVPGWEHVQKPAADDSTIDVEAFDTAEELETLGQPFVLLQTALAARCVKARSCSVQPGRACTPWYARPAVCRHCGRCPGAWVGCWATALWPGSDVWHLLPRSCTADLATHCSLLTAHCSL